MRVIVFLIVSTLILFQISCSDYHEVKPNPKYKDFQKDFVPNQDDPEQNKNFTTPTKKISLDQYPKFEDDLDFKNMLTALDRQLKRYNQRSLKKFIKIGGVNYKLSHLKKSIIEFRKLIVIYNSCRVTQSQTHCMSQFDIELKSKFNVFAPDLKKGDKGFGQKSFAHFTAYYTPTLQGRLEKSEDYPYAIYNRPKGKEDLACSTRQQIDFRGVLEDKGYDIFYTPDLFELYLLQVEGGGKVELPDGSSYYLSYDGTNKRQWRFISLYMRDQGMIDNLSIYAQRKYLERHPEKYEEIYSTCPSYVYFKVTDTQPEGSDLVPLTNNRSIATDYRNYLFKGMIAFVKSKRLRPHLKDGDYDPLEPAEKNFMDFSRFMLDQDTGGAIKGKARVDLYFGEDAYASRAAQYVNHPGELYFLLLKK